MKKQILYLPDIQCPSCVMRLESLEDELPGVQRVKASYKKQQMEIEYDESLITEAGIRAAVEKKGYTIARVE